MSKDKVIDKTVLKLGVNEDVKLNDIMGNAKCFYTAGVDGSIC